jgi:UDP-N-acetyl-2-amino-2-deoxyglucuronate dehydrogenase
MKTVNFAILGCGKIGSRHAEKIKNTDYVRLVAVCDTNKKRAKELAEKHVCKAYYSLKDMLKDPDIDFVNICTPSGYHAEHTISCLNAKKNVLCEKPMALSVSDATRMIAAAKKNRRLLYVVKQNRYNPPIKLVQELMQKKKLGKPLMCIVNMLWNRDDAYYNSDPWRGTKKLDGGTIFTQATHFIDLMIMLMGKPVSVYSLMDTFTHNIEIEDTGTVTTRFTNGSIGVLNFTTSATKKNFEGSITLIFEKGTIRIGGEYINTIDYFEVSGVKSYVLEESTVQANDYGTYRGSMSNHQEIFKDIVKKFNNNKYVGKLVFGDEAIETIRFTEDALASAVTGKPVFTTTAQKKKRS